MRITLALMVLFFIEIILETGLQIHTTLGAGISVKNVLIYSLFLAAVSRWYNEAAVYRDKRVNSLLLLYAAFVLYCIASLGIPLLLSTPDYDFLEGLINAKAILIDPILCFVFFWIFTKRYLSNPERILKILLVVVTFFCFLMLLERIVPSIRLFGVDNSSDIRLNGPFGEPNQTAAVLSLCLPLSIALVFIHGRARIFYAASAMSMLMCIIITGSRGGILGAGIGCLYLLWAIRSHLALSNKILMISTVPILGILAWYIIPESSRDLILVRFSFINESDIDWEEASAGRVYLWKIGLQLWQDSPIFGRGWSSFNILTGNASHSIYLDYLVSLGIIGLAIVLTFYQRLFHYYMATIKLYRNHDTTLLLTGTSAGLIALLVSLAFVNLYTPWISVWCILGAAAGYVNALKTLARIRVIRNQT